MVKSPAWMRTSPSGTSSSRCSSWVSLIRTRRIAAEDVALAFFPIYVTYGCADEKWTGGPKIFSWAVSRPRVSESPPNLKNQQAASVCGLKREDCRPRRIAHRKSDRTGSTARIRLCAIKLPFISFGKPSRAQPAIQDADLCRG
jgi:hypothetical protein